MAWKLWFVAGIVLTLERRKGLSGRELPRWTLEDPTSIFHWISGWGREQCLLVSNDSRVSIFLKGRFKKNLVGQNISSHVFAGFSFAPKNEMFFFHMDFWRSLPKMIWFNILRLESNQVTNLVSVHSSLQLPTKRSRARGMGNLHPSLTGSFGNQRLPKRYLERGNSTYWLPIHCHHANLQLASVIRVHINPLVIDIFVSYQYGVIARWKRPPLSELCSVFSVNTVCLDWVSRSSYCSHMVIKINSHGI